MLEAGLNDELKQVFVELGDELGVRVTAGVNHIDKYMAAKTDENMEKVLTSIADARWGKGRFAHRLIKHVQDKADSLPTQNQKNGLVPKYIQDGIQFLLAKVETE
ncbi:MAG: hypothetical protein KAU10_00720, partial [Dehalococcoidia bacterium]|nr:hypothetical protein [Dehalococcoidia bacterium]